MNNEPKNTNLGSAESNPQPHMDITPPRPGSSMTSSAFTSHNLATPEQPAPQPQMDPINQPPKKKKWWLWIVIAVVLLALAGGGLWWWLGSRPSTTNSQSAGNNGKVTLTIAVHWQEDQQINGIKNADGSLKSKGLKQYLDEYTTAHPNIAFKVEQILYDQYANKLQTLSDSGAAPDIYQIYAPWGASFVRKDALAEPPAAIQQDVKDSYISAAGPTIEGKLWGIPTEIDNYALLYNKDLFKQAGIVDAKGNPVAPKTWQDVLADAKKLTKRDGKGAITQYGFATLYDNDWQSVDPFLSLLFSNGGQYLSDDLTSAQFNSAAGVAALTAQAQLFRDGSTDASSNFYDFGKGKVGLVIAPPWVKANFATALGDKFAATVGVAPFPSMKNSTSLQYSWFTGVMKGSTHQKEAWDFLAWFTQEKQASGTTRYGDLLAETIGAIPARKVDFDSHKDVLGDFFTGVYVDQMKNSKAEPNVLQASNIKAALMSEIQAAWDNKKTPQQALDNAATAVNAILKQNYR